ncbi:serine hydrolase-like protein 2 isoform X1 [Gorilla gorilla gorilla]|uniref:serine hydrolase-like protein 2 isoform X1 n=1 Tax=Gorilla gorilla gorilla TaxID=9595 RepID=UPI0024463401|nr:serine hydrolase-like protein 2 isoform X1 [Gorilla gorilla gorilla]
MHFTWEDRRALPGAGLISELKLAVPWGHIAAKAWGSLQGPPVLCLHGWLDNANSFDRLIPLLPQDFYYVAMDFGGHGLSSHYSPGVPYYLQTFVSEIRRVVAALKWNRFSILGHSFGGVVGGMFSCTFPEMVDKLILLDTLVFLLESNEMENLLTYKRRAIEHMLQVEASQELSRVFSLKQLLQRLLKSNSHLSEECGELLLQRGTTKVATGLVLNRDQRLSWVENSIDYVSRELCAHYIRKLQAHVLLIKAVHGYFDPRENYSEESLSFMIDTMKSTLKERFQFVEVPGNHCVHMSEPQHVANIISSFLQRTHTLPAVALGLEL